MKLLPMIAAAGVAASLIAIPASPASAQRGYYDRHHHGGPGWNRWRERRVAGPGWYGPVWHGVRGPHYGWYRWNNRFYRNCSWRWGRHHRRVWRCW